MSSVEEALRLVEKHASPLAPRRVALDDAAELLLAEDVTSAVNSPPYDKTLMDGYAVVSSDRAEVREVLEEVGAGSVPRRPVTPGTVTRLMTGAPLPEGADAVIAFEQTEPIDDRQVRFLQTDPKPGQHVLTLGAALRIGQRVFDRGIAAAANRNRHPRRDRPRRGPRASATQGRHSPHRQRTRRRERETGRRADPQQQRPDAPAAIARAGGDAIELPVARDEHGELERLITAGLDADVLLLCGGVSAGKFDLVPGALAALGVEEVFHKVALRPGKPLWFGVKHFGDRQVLVFGLPGNPVSSLVCYELFARPAISALAGRGFVTPSHVTARLAHDFKYKGGRASCLPAAISRPRSGDKGADERQPPTVEILPWHGSADLVALARANGLVRFGTEPNQFATGATVQVMCL